MLRAFCHGWFTGTPRKTLRQTPTFQPDVTLPMTLRRLLSNLADAEARRGAARALAVVCAVGYALTTVVMAASGSGLRRWFFALLVWGALIYIPLRILLEAFQTIAPAMRQRLIAQTATRADRYSSRPAIELVVDGLLGRGVVMPRIATPAQHTKAKEGAVAVLERARGDGAAIEIAAVRCLATVERWVTQLASWSAGEAGENIQARWADVRALIALAVATTVLIAASEDRSGGQFTAGSLDGSPAAAYLEACLDFCDQLALDVDVVPWAEPGLRLDIAPSLRDRTRAAWTRFSETPSPALEARSAFVNAVLTE